MDVPNWLLQQLIQLGDDEDVDSDPDDPDERQDGEASQAELQRLDAADWRDLKPAYAAACARACVVARELPVALPPELIAAIAENSAEAPVERLCACGQRRREELTMTPVSSRFSYTPVAAFHPKPKSLSFTRSSTTAPSVPAFSAICMSGAVMAR